MKKSKLEVAVNVLGFIGGVALTVIGVKNSYQSGKSFLEGLGDNPEEELVEDIDEDEEEE